MIDLYGMSSPNVEKILIMLEETSLPYRLQRVDVFKGGQFSPQFRKLNPNGKVPVIVDAEGPDGQEHAVFESGAILLYLAEKTGLFLPTSFGPKYEVLQWLILQVANVGPMLGQLNHFQFLKPPGSDYALQRYRNEARRLYDLLDARLRDHPYLAGKEYSLADIATYPWVSYHERHRMEWNDRPNLARWHALIGGRPGVARAAEAMRQIKPLDEQAWGAASKEDLDRFFNRTAEK